MPSLSETFKLQLNRWRRDANGFPLIRLPNSDTVKRILTEDDSGGGGSGVSSVNTRTGAVTLAKSDVGLGNADNTADTAKPVSTAQQTALDAKVPTSRTVNGHALSADVTVSKSDVSLGNVTDDAQLKAADLDTDATMAANSDAKVASQKAVKTALATKTLALLTAAVNYVFPKPAIANTPVDVVIEAGDSNFEDNDGGKVVLKGGEPSGGGDPGEVEVFNQLKINGGAPTEAYHATRKDYVDGLVASHAGGQKKIYRALVTQSGSTAPTAKVLENSIGAGVWSRVDSGQYLFTLANAFTADKTWFALGWRSASGNEAVVISRVSADAISLIADDDDNGMFQDGPLEIVVYP